MGFTVELNRKALRDANACADGVQVFDAIVAMQGRKHSIRTEWTLLHQLWFCQAYPSFASWVRSKRLLPWIDLRGSNLRGSNLSYSDLRYSDLSGSYRPTDPPAGWEPDANGYLRKL